MDASTQMSVLKSYMKAKAAVCATRNSAEKLVQGLELKLHAMAW